MGIKDLFKNVKDPKMKTEREICEYFKLPVLAIIPEHNFKRGRRENEK